MNDELRQRLRRLDPMPPHVHTDPMTSPSSHALLEEIMNTTIDRPAEIPTPARRSTPRWAIAGAAAAVLAVAAGAIAVGVTGGDGADEPTVSQPPLDLSLGAGDDPMAMCMVFDTAILADMPVAFEGTVSAVEGELVTLDVDEWFAGGEAEQVRLEAAPGMEALIGGIAFTEGEQYLVTATDGVVNYCGYTGPSTPELRSAFETAFPG